MKEAKNTPKKELEKSYYKRGVNARYVDITNVPQH